jgi:hypothetical protein
MDNNFQQQLNDVFSQISESMKQAGIPDEVAQQRMVLMFDYIQTQISQELVDKLPVEQLQELANAQDGMDSQTMATKLNTSAEATQKMVLDKLHEYQQTLPDEINRIKQKMQAN